MEQKTGITRRQFIVTGGATAFAMYAALGLAGCGNGGQAKNAVPLDNLKDGTYTGQSSTLEAHSDGDGYGVITITVKDGKIADASFQAFMPDGTPKDENYGKDGAYYNVAQNVVSAIDDYASTLVEAGTPDGVDAISGATFLYDQFIEATEDALSQAK